MSLPWEYKLSSSILLVMHIAFFITDIMTNNMIPYNNSNHNTSLPSEYIWLYTMIAYSLGEIIITISWFIKFRWSKLVYRVSYVLTLSYYIIGSAVLIAWGPGPTFESLILYNQYTLMIVLILRALLFLMVLLLMYHSIPPQIDTDIVFVQHGDRMLY